MGRKRIIKPHEQRRRELMDAARELFLQKGYEETSMADIAHSAQVASGTFYLYFKSKQDVLRAIVRDIGEEIAGAVQDVVTRTDLPALEKLRTAMVRVIERMSQQKRLVQAIYLHANVSIPLQLLEEYHPRVIPAIRAILEQGIREGTFKVSNPMVAADFLWALGYRYFERVAKQRLDGDGASPAELEQAFWEFVSHGLGVPRMPAVSG